MPAERLWVVRGGETIADLERTDDQQLLLRYRPALVDRAPDAPVLSVSLPVRVQPYNGPALLPFFDGLLPEGRARDRLAARFRLDAGDTFGLLREIGRDCAGALSIVPDGTDLVAVRAEGVEWLSEEALAREIEDLAERPLAVNPAEGIRISLAGVQDKMAVVLDAEGRVGLPRGTTPSTHILKPASTERRGRRSDRLAYPGLVANEAFCGLLGRRAGLTVAHMEVRRVGGEGVLLSERYDRTTDTVGVRRIHQEDFCQALGFRSTMKYETDGGPKVAAYLQLLARWSSDVAADQDELLDRIAFNYLIGNADAHAKNHSLLYGAGGVRLAPAYDVVSTYAYEQLDERMANSINGMFDASALGPAHWRKWLEQIGLSVRLYGNRLGALAQRVEAAIPDARSAADRWSVPDAPLDRIITLALARAPVLRAISS